MGPAKPKLWIIGGAAGPDAERLLAGAYDTAAFPPGPLAEIDPGHGPDVLLVSPSDMRKLTAAPAAAAALLDSMGQGACLTDLAGEVIWSNTKYLTYDDRTKAQIATACRDAILYFQGGPSVGPAHAQATRRVEIGLPDSGKHFEIIMSPATPADGGKGHGGSVAAIIRDVTSDYRLRKKMDAIDRAGSELVSLEASSVKKMNVFERLRLLETKIVQLCRDLLKFDNFSIRLIDEKTNRMEMVISSGLPQEAIELEIYAASDGNGISGYVGATGRSYICPDTEKDPRFLPGLVGARSSLTVPLRLHDRIIGIFNIESQQVGAFTEDDRQFAEIFGRYVAIALHMLNLLVVERGAVNATVTQRVEGELHEPLDDILKEADWLKDLAARDPNAARHIERIRSDVEAIHSRVRNVASGPQTLLGIEGAMAERKIDPALQGKRILVADDEANVRRIIHDVLHNRGCIVQAFESGVGAIAALEAIGAGKQPAFDAVLSDIRMPDRNGYEVFAAARKHLPGVPVILMTGFGYDPHHSIVRASQEGLQAVLFKPFPVDRLLDEVKKAVAKK
jgi:CheY-like chemotaxis protein/GAF domain-containing protein